MCVYLKNLKVQLNKMYLKIGNLFVSDAHEMKNCCQI